MKTITRTFTSSFQIYCIKSRQDYPKIIRALGLIFVGIVISFILSYPFNLISAPFLGFIGFILGSGTTKIETCDPNFDNHTIGFGAKS